MNAQGFATRASDEEGGHAYALSVADAENTLVSNAVFSNVPATPVCGLLAPCTRHTCTRVEQNSRPTDHTSSTAAAPHPAVVTRQLDCASPQAKVSSIIYRVCVHWVQYFKHTMPTFQDTVTEHISAHMHAYVHAYVHMCTLPSTMR